MQILIVLRTLSRHVCLIISKFLFPYDNYRFIPLQIKWNTNTKHFQPDPFRFTLVFPLISMQHLSIDIILHLPSVLSVNRVRSNYGTPVFWESMDFNIVWVRLIILSLTWSNQINILRFVNRCVRNGGKHTSSAHLTRTNEIEEAVGFDYVIYPIWMSCSWPSFILW